MVAFRIAFLLSDPGEAAACSVAGARRASGACAPPGRDNLRTVERASWVHAGAGVWRGADAARETRCVGARAASL